RRRLPARPGLDRAGDHAGRLGPATRLVDPGTGGGGAVKFAPGEVLLRRHWRGGGVRGLFVARGAAGGERGRPAWLSEGSPFWRVTEPRVTPGQAASDQMPGARLVAGRWARTDAMIWMPPDAAYSVWWFWSDGAFAGWKANLEEPHVRWS